MGAKHRDEYEQLEYQRKNPELFTTLSQMVNFDGSITTFDQLTAKMQEELEKLNKDHKKRYSGSHPDFCMKPIMWASEEPICQMIDMLEDDMAKVRVSFIENYKMQHSGFDHIYYKGKEIQRGSSK